jgi:hypothetical protein
MQMSPSRTVPVFLICALVLAVVINGAAGKKNQTFDGLVVQENTFYEFYPDVQGCLRQGTPYWLVPNREFYETVHTSTDLEHLNLDRLVHGSWRVRLIGDLSHIGRYGYQDKFWRELSVRYVMNANQLNCDDAPSR